MPPVILIKRPFAPSNEKSSNSGLATAALAHSTALFSPEACPVPIIARPISLIIVFTSAKSKLINPGTTIKSVMLLTPA